MRLLAAYGAILLCALAVVVVPRSADAAIVPASVLDGPNSSVLEVDGAALASDGTGGVVFRALQDGEPHVFVSRFLGGSWQAPRQVDLGQAGPVTFPTIAAADGGELLVVWVQPWAWISSSPGSAATLHYELMSAVLQPGATSFSQIERIADVGDGTAAYPSLAMAPNGSAYVAYRVVTNPLASGTTLPIQPMRPGDELVNVRVSRFNGLNWSEVGVVNRSPGQVTMRKPSASNAPVVVVNDRSQALVVWQEPEINGVARIWARRLFGSSKGNVLAVSPTTIDGKPVDVDADAPAVALSPYGQAEVAFRLAGGTGSPLGSPAIMLNTLPMPVTEVVSSFTGPTVLDSAAGIGPPSVAVESHNKYRVAYTAAGAARLVSGTENGSGSPSVLGGADGELAFTTIDPEGGGTTVWQSTDSSGLPVVQAREDFPGGSWQGGYLSAPLSGPVSDLVSGESGLGDVLIAFRQGPAGGSQVMATFAQTPPETFQVTTPSEWVSASKAAISWEEAPDAIGPVSYAVLIDGRVVVRDLSGLSAKLDPHVLGDGRRRIQVLASDDLGQQTMSGPASLDVESNPPQVAVKRLSGVRVKVRVYDDPAGIEAGKTLVDFGDGTTVTGRDSAVHTYRHAGRYTIVVHATDKVGNQRDAHVRVQVR
jgi:PKD domain